MRLHEFPNEIMELRYKIAKEARKSNPAITHRDVWVDTPKTGTIAGYTVIKKEKEKEKKSN